MGGTPASEHLIDNRLGSEQADIPVVDIPTVYGLASE